MVLKQRRGKEHQRRSDASSSSWRGLKRTLASNAVKEEKLNDLLERQVNPPESRKSRKALAQEREGREANDDGTYPCPSFFFAGSKPDPSIDDSIAKLPPSDDLPASFCSPATHELSRTPLPVIALDEAVEETEPTAFE